MEQRNYARLKSNLNAKFATKDNKNHDCVIIDFCIHGMRLSAQNLASISDEIGVTAGQKIIIQFTAPWGGAPKNFETIGIVTQVINNEIGLKIPSFLPEAFQAIRASNAHHPVEKRNKTSLHDVNNIMAQSVNNLHEMLEVASDKLFEKMDLRLQKQHDESMVIHEQDNYKFAIKYIKENRKKIQDDLILFTQKRVTNENSTIEKKLEEDKISVNSLSLVTHNEIDDWIHLSSIATRLNEKFTAELTALSQRLADLVDHPITDKENPFSPSTLMECLREALKNNITDIEKQNEVKNFFYEEFGEILSDEYPVFITAIDKIIPFSGKNKSRHTNKAQKTNTQKIEENNVQTAPQPNNFNFETILKLINNRNDDSYKITQENTTSLNEEQNNDRTIEINSNGLIRLINKIRELGNQINPRKKEDSLSGLVDSKNKAEQASIKDISQAIDRIEKSHGIIGTNSLSEQIQEEINSDSTELRLMTDKEREALDSMALIYDKAVPPSSQENHINRMVKKLEGPLLKTVLNDESLLNSKQHPARRVVDLIDQFSISTDDKGNIQDINLQKNLNQVVDRIINDYQQGGSSYLETAKQSLEDLLDPLQKDRILRITKFQEDSEAREHIRDAHRKIDDYLEARFASSEVAELLDQLLREGWQQYLVNIALRDGMKGAGWNQGEIALERLMTWSEPKFTPETKQRFEVSAWLSMVERHLSTVCTDYERLKIFMALAKKLLEQTQEPISRPLTRIYLPANRFTKSEQSIQNIRDKFAYLIDKLKVGEYWEVFKNKAWVPMQMIWLSNPPGACSLTNRSATELLELTLEEFSNRIDSNTLRSAVNYDLPLLERAEHAIIDDAFSEVHHQATHSHIAGMWNRNGFMLNLTNIAHDRRKLDQLHVLMVIGFDQIEMIYTQRGIEAGDELIHRIAEKFSSQLRKEDIMAAFTDSSFSLLLINVDRQYTQGVADKILNQFKDFNYTYKDEVYSIGVNIGLVTYIPSSITPDEGIRRANAAYDAATRLGRNRIQWYDAGDSNLEDQQALAKWAGRIDHMFRDNRFYLRCQMIIPLATDVPLLPRYEILLGIHSDSEDGSRILTSEFIPVVERLRRIHEIDLWVLEEFFFWASENEDIISSIESFSVNLSAKSLSNLEILEFLHEKLINSGDLPRKIFFEITETVAIDGYNAAQSFIDQIRHYGCRFSIDDFGSGHSSYTHLKKLNTDELKIDGFFVNDISNSDKDYAMVKSMNEIAHSLGMRTVAEHADSSEAIKCLREIGVDYVQGYYLHEPMPLENLSLATHIPLISSANS
jgi:diguanylate cyclase (GGDEF)-like protein